MATSENDEPGTEGVRHRRAQEAREEALGTRERAGSTREHTVGLREDSVRDRELALSLREELVRAKEETAWALAASERALRTEAEYRERLIGIVGHDLRNPVTAIAMAAELLARDEKLPTRDRSRVESIRASTRRVKRIIDELLDFTLAHLGGGLRLNLKQVDLRDISKRVVEELELGQRRVVRIDCHFEGDVAGLWDADRLEQVISNLAGNALQHGDRDKSVVLTAVGGPDEVVVEVSNEGPPIPPELLPRLFTAFSRGNPGERTRTGSLGLGLYIVHEIVTRHGGTLTVRSAEGRTTFTLRLPRKPPGDPAAEPPALEAGQTPGVGTGSPTSG